MSEISTRTVGPKAAKRAVQKAFKHNRPLFLWGPPGIGKSEIVHQIGADIDAWGAASRLNMQQSRVYSSAKADIKETMHYAANELERSIQSKRSGKNWEGFGEL